MGEREIIGCQLKEHNGERMRGVVRRWFVERERKQAVSGYITSMIEA